MRRGRTTRLTAVASVAVAALAAVPAPARAAAEVRTLCAERATLKSTPGGIVVAHLRRPQRLTLSARTPDGAWAQVRTRAGTRGWILSRTLCPR